MDRQIKEIDMDQHHLNLLSIFHYVLGGMLYVFGLFPVLHFMMGVLMLTGALGADNPEDEAALRILGCMFVLLPIVFVAGAWTLATLVIIAGRKLARHLSYTFCLVIAGIECIFMPLGTILGVFTIIVLSRPGVKSLFTALDLQEK